MDKRIEYAKIIHDALVAADLADKRTVKELKPVVADIRLAIADGLDSMNIAGVSGWMESSVRYFDRLKGEPVIDVAPDALYGAQTSSAGGTRISPYPDRIVLHGPDVSETIVEMGGIKEAIISPEGDRVAFIRAPETQNGVEIWTVSIAKRDVKRIATLPSCRTIVFSMNGRRIAFQETPDSPGAPSPYGRLSTRSGRIRRFGTAALVDTVIRDGDHRNALVVYRPTPHPLGIPDRACPYAVTWRGAVIGRIGNLDCL